MRGRLISPQVIRIGLLDTLATGQDDPDGAGPLISGYDDVFREPSLVSKATNPLLIGASAQVPTQPRVERFIEVRAQIETKKTEELRQMQAGNSPQTIMWCICHFPQLEEAGIVDAQGQLSIKVNARLDSIYTTTGELIEVIPAIPGMYATEVASISYGLGLVAPGTRNLLQIQFEDREQSVVG